MKISVVIPALNEEKYLPQTLTSLLRLARKPDEILVIDGGSTDTTPLVAKKFGARVLQVTHGSIGLARQRGIEQAHGDIIAFTDADTIVPSDWLTKIEETLLRPGVVGVFGTFRVPDGWLPYRLYINRIQPILNRAYYWARLPMAAGQNLAFYKDAAIKVGGIPKDFKIAEDIELARRLMTVGRVVFRPDLVVTSSGRRGNEGLSLIPRISKSFFYYLMTRRADRYDFPHIR